MSLSPRSAHTANPAILVSNTSHNTGSSGGHSGDLHRVDVESYILGEEREGRGFKRPRPGSIREIIFVMSCL